MKRIARIVAFVTLACLAYYVAERDVQVMPPASSVAAWHAAPADALVSNGIEGGRPPARHVEE
jgi:hypothetical protein